MSVDLVHVCVFCMSLDSITSYQYSLFQLRSSTNPFSRSSSANDASLTKQVHTHTQSRYSYICVFSCYYIPFSMSASAKEASLPKKKKQVHYSGASYKGRQNASAPCGAFEMDYLPLSQSR